MSDSLEIAALRRKPRDPDLHEVFDRASWAHAMASLDEFWLWLNHRLQLASNQLEREWLSRLADRVGKVIRIIANRSESDKYRLLRSRRRLLSKITELGRRDVRAAYRQEAALYRMAEREEQFRKTKRYQDQMLQEAQDRWEIKKQALIAREEARRIQGRWLISR